MLSESAVIITALSRTFLIDEALVDIFDAVLLQENLPTLVQNGRELNPSDNVMGRLGKAVRKPFNKFTIKSLVSYFIWLPLNFIPVVGTVIFIFVQGRKLGPTYHARYFQLKGYNAGQRSTFVEQNKPAYIRYFTRIALRGFGLMLTSIQFWCSFYAPSIDPSCIDFVLVHKHGWCSFVGCRYREGLPASGGEAHRRHGGQR